MNYSIVFLGDRHWQSTCDIFSILKGMLHMFYITMQYSKALQKHVVHYILSVFSGFGESFRLGWLHFVSPNP